MEQVLMKSSDGEILEMGLLKLSKREYICIDHGYVYQILLFWLLD
jgi:hypothetical protein